VILSSSEIEAIRAQQSSDDVSLANGGPKHLMGPFAIAHTQRGKLLAEVDRLRAALLRHGRHDDGEVDGTEVCEATENGPGTCTCGFDDALRAVATFLGDNLGNRDWRRPDGGPRGTLADAVRVCGAVVGSDGQDLVRCMLSEGHAGPHR